MREVRCRSLYHQFERCIRWDIIEVVPPQNTASLTVNPKELKKGEEEKNESCRKK